MNLSLTRKSNRRAGIEIFNRSTVDPLHRQTGTLAGLKFSFQICARLVRRLEQIAVEPLELAVNVFVRDDPFDAIDGCAVTLRGHARAIFAMISFQIVVAIIQRVHQMRCGAASHPTPNQSII